MLGILNLQMYREDRSNLFVFDVEMLSLNMEDFHQCIPMKIIRNTPNSQREQRIKQLF